MTVLRELFRYKLGSMGVHEVRLEGIGTEPAVEYEFSMVSGIRTMN
jgi:hypothetical protein